LRLKKGNKLAVLSIGTIAKNVNEAIEFSMNKDDISHYDMRFVKPLDETLLHTIFKTYSCIITIEDNSIKGGFGSTILEFASAHNYKNIIKLLDIPDTFIQHGSLNELQELTSLNPLGVKREIDSLFSSNL